MLDQVILVNEQDEEIGVMDKLAAHRDGGQLHRAISVFLFNQEGELLIQQRSAQKIVGAGQWANSCCGNLRPGESYEDCAKRRLREELGLEQIKLKPAVKFQYFAPCNEIYSEREMDQVFVACENVEWRLNPAEVSGAKWIKWEAFLTMIEAQDSSIVPWLFEMQKADVLRKIAEERKVVCQ